MRSFVAAHSERAALAGDDVTEQEARALLGEFERRLAADGVALEQVGLLVLAGVGRCAFGTPFLLCINCNSSSWLIVHSQRKPLCVVRAQVLGRSNTKSMMLGAIAERLNKTM